MAKEIFEHIIILIVFLISSKVIDFTNTIHYHSNHLTMRFIVMSNGESLFFVIPARWIFRKVIVFAKRLALDVVVCRYVQAVTLFKVSVKELYFFRWCVLLMLRIKEIQWWFVWSHSFNVIHKDILSENWRYDSESLLAPHNTCILLINWTFWLAAKIFP